MELELCLQPSGTIYYSSSATGSVTVDWGGPCIQPTSLRVLRKLPLRLSLPASSLCATAEWNRHQPLVPARVSSGGPVQAGSWGVQPPPAPQLAGPLQTRQALCSQQQRDT